MGFIKNFHKDEAKEIIEGLLNRLNSGERFESQELERALGEYIRPEAGFAVHYKVPQYHHATIPGDVLRHSADALTGEFKRRRVGVATVAS